eukprot:756109-Hanusia_phi.AAC.2
MSSLSCLFPPSPFSLPSFSASSHPDLLLQATLSLKDIAERSCAVPGLNEVKSWRPLSPPTSLPLVLCPCRQILLPPPLPFPFFLPSLLFLNSSQGSISFFKEQLQILQELAGKVSTQGEDEMSWWGWGRGDGAGEEEGGKMRLSKMYRSREPSRTLRML